MSLPAFLESLLAAISASGTLPGLVNVPLQLGLDRLREQRFQQLRTQLEYRFKDSEQRMVTRADLETSEFFANAVLKIVREYFETASEIKRQALANAIGGYVDPKTAAWPDKDILVRVLIQLTGVEIQVLTVISQANENVPGDKLADLLGMDVDAVRVVCEGLRQIGIVRDPSWDQYEDDKPGNWRCTNLGRRLITFASHR